MTIPAVVLPLLLAFSHISQASASHPHNPPEYVGYSTHRAFNNLARQDTPDFLPSTAEDEDRPGLDYRGVNLGGWLILEKWMCETVFSHVPAAGDDFSLAEGLLQQGGPELRDRVYREHRENWLSKEDFLRIKEAGLNSVRIPFGYWLFYDYPDMPFPYGDGPEFVGQALDWAEEAGLKVVLDLHGAPGFQRGHQACGRSNDDWKPSDWDTPATLEVIRIVASNLLRTFAGHPAVSGFAVINEPSPLIPLPRLLTYYQDAYKIIREEGMAVEDVAVFMPVFIRMMSAVLVRFFWPVWQWYFPSNSQEYQNIIFDVHTYQCFGPWEYVPLDLQLLGAWYGWPQMPSSRGVSKHGYKVVVSEWSLALPFWDNSKSMTKSWSALSPREKDGFMRAFAANQIYQFERDTNGGGWIFWTWKVDISGSTEKYPATDMWSIQGAIERGWLSVV